MAPLVERMVPERDAGPEDRRVVDERMYGPEPLGGPCHQRGHVGRVGDVHGAPLDVRAVGQLIGDPAHVVLAPGAQNEVGAGVGKGVGQGAAEAPGRARNEDHPVGETGHPSVSSGSVSLITSATARSSWPIRSSRWRAVRTLA